MPKMKIPEHWNASQALAVYEFLDELGELIWIRYSEEIQKAHAAERYAETEDFDDDISF